ncbi:polysaccharide deacetylase family protein [Streptomyces sp. NPDC003077]|uniref:polysaccharide deacetylase family protein n=1 Tax=Streptomyces sp. NPDC003077 TaxID=3154443 RepID=UPI0033B59AD2
MATSTRTRSATRPRLLATLLIASLAPALAACAGSGAGDAGRAAPARSPARATPSAARAGPMAVPTLAAASGGRAPVFTRGTWPAKDGNRADGTGGGTKPVALTFDGDMAVGQGPRAARGERFDNPALIATLRRLKVPATMFLTGRWAEQYPDQARSIGRDPLFEVANHSYSHHAFADSCYGMPHVPQDAMRGDAERAFDAFRRAGARRWVPYFRFPGGCYDDRALRTLAPSGMTVVQWDVVSGDAFADDADPVVRQVLAQVRPGSVVVLHCTRSAAPATEEAVRRVVPALRDRGYRLMKVSQLLAGQVR